MSISYSDDEYITSRTRILMRTKISKEITNLIFACESQNNDKFIELFESDNSDPSIENNILPKTAIESNNIEILSYLLQKGANISNEDMYKSAFFYGTKINMIKFLFDRGIDFVTNTKFISRCINNADKNDIVEFLLEQGMDPNKLLDANAPEKHLIDIATKDYNQEIIEILISHGADPSLSTSRCLSFAIQTGEEKIIRLLLNNGAIPSSVTPKDLSIMLGSKPRLSLIKFLVDQGFDFSMVNSVKFDRSYINEVCPVLFELGVDPLQLINIYDEYNEKENEKRY